MNKISINNFLLQNRLPSASAIISIDKTLTYEQLVKYSGSLKTYFSEQGVYENDFVGIFSEHTVEFVISVLALWKIGAVPVLLNPKITLPELNELLQSVKCSRVIGSIDQQKKNNFTEQEFIAIPGNLEEKSFEKKTGEVNPEKTAAIIFTSGSSDKPKGVKLFL